MDELEPTDPRGVGRYRITARLGAGGMGRVYLGRSPSGRLVAVKVVRPELADDAGFRRRFAREVAAARKVTGFFTAAVVDADPDGSPPWLATAYVPGMALDTAVAAHGPWPVDAVRALGAGLAEALEAVHAAGLVHRDLKPSNVLLAPDGPRVVDFGISVAAEATALTRTGTVVGTPGFMAPEQLTGAPVTPATDVFALGAVLAYAATGTGPFGSGSAQALNFRIAYEEPDLTGLPAPLAGVVARCLAKDPARRPAVSALVDELAPAVPDSAGHAPTEITDGATAWLPPAVARALTVTATAPPPKPDPPAPTPAPAAHRPPVVPPPPPPPPATRRRGTLPLGFAMAALVLSLFLPAVESRSVMADLSEGAWPFAVAAALSVCTSVACLRTTDSVPRTVRFLHKLTTALSSGLITLLLLSVGSASLQDDLGPGAYVYALGCLFLIVSLVRLPSGKPGHTRT
ncbi:serine/threonine-protein kinase [Streptomyces sp. RFCAC02]|uniref:serine/threonine-protein kinase n=1 Tax=Streptomyces sp. RFCAC02 TaxID=2499143 RepID=UPI0023EA5844|nr:serine/threonine-protein kinase [Streptomyces sp. RFCAC02]